MKLRTALNNRLSLPLMLLTTLCYGQANNEGPPHNVINSGGDSTNLTTLATSSESHNGEGAVPEDVALGAATRGMVRATAAINANGTVASCFG